jgi:hypothetical protein
MEETNNDNQPQRNHKVDFLALKKNIEDQILLGYAAKAIWLKLKYEKMLCMSYGHFARFIRTHKFKNKQQTSKISPSAQNPTNQATPSQSKVKREPLKCWTEEKPRRMLNISTIGKEYLLEPYTGDKD